MKVPRLLARENMEFSEDVKKIARDIRAHVPWKGGTDALIACPVCGRPMVRKLFTAIYPHSMDIDVCDPCDAIWFDGNELEIVQCLCQKRESL